MLLATPLISAPSAQFVVLGLAAGALTALVSLGIVLVHRASGVLNFGAGALGGVSAFLCYQLRGDGLPSWLALAIGLVLGGVLGAMTYGIVALLRHGSLLAKLVAMLGVLGAAQGVMVIVWGTDISQPNSYLPTANVTLPGGISVGEDRLILVGIAVALAIALKLIYSRTLFGLATSAVAENPQVAASAGWSTNAVSLVNFVISGVLSAFAAIMLAPIVTLNASVFSVLVLPAFAAALVGRFSSFGITVSAALVIGVLQSELSLFQPDLANAFGVSVPSLTGLAQAIPLVVILGYAIASGRARPSRGETSAALPLPGTGRVPVVPTIVGIGLFAVFIATAESWTFAIATTFAVGIVLCSIVLLTGYAGQLSLCQYALAGFGAWVSSRLVATHDISFLLAVAIGVALTAGAGLLIATVAVRTRGLNLAIATLAVALLFEAVIFTNPSVTGGFEGTVVRPPSLFGISFDPNAHPQRFASLVMVVFGLTALLVSNIRRGRIGRRMLAVRSNERAAASLGISVLGVKLYVFAIAAAIAAMGGILLAFQNTNVEFTGFDVFGSVLLVQYAVIGGLGWVSGVIAGAVAAPGALGAELLNRIFPNLGNVGSWLAIGAAVGVVILLRQSPDGVAAQWSGAFGGKRGIRYLPGDRPPPVQHFVAAASPSSLAVRDLTVRFGGVTALSDVSLAAAPGEVVGLIGPNGAGKTTLLDVMTGFTRPSEGTVVLDGHDMKTWTPERRARAGIARSWQAVELFNEMTILDNLLVASDRHERRRYFTDLFHPGRQGLTAAGWRVVEDFGLSGVLNEKPAALPQGIARLVGIARAIMAEPTILFLDEPAAGLDQVETREFAAVIRRIAEQRNIPIVLVEHDVPLILSTCDRIVVLDFGKQIATGTPDEIRRDARVIAAYLGDAPAPAQITAPGQAAVRPRTTASGLA